MTPAPAAAPLPEATRPPRPRGRRALLATVALFLAVLAASLSSPWWFNARRVADFALLQVGTATGLDWSYNGEPALRWRPHPWLSLPGLRVRDAAGRTLLAAERFEIAVPWSTLRGESMQVDALNLVAPDLDLETAAAWWNARPPADADVMPELDGLSVTRGRVQWPGGALQDLELTLPRFALGELLTLELSGRVTERRVGDGSPFLLSLQLDARPEASPLRLEDVELRLDGTGPVAPTVARGRVQFAPWSLDASGEIASWPATWPALPAPLSASLSPIRFTLAQHGESATMARTMLAIDRDASHIDATGTPEALMAWLEDGEAAALPPLQARAEFSRIDVDGVQLEGVTIELDEAPAPPSAAPGEHSR